MGATYSMHARKGKRLVEICKLRWENNLKLDLKKIGCGGVERINLDQDRI
jgi:hypothetical protein